MIGGVTYDRITFPENFRTAPISNKEKTVDGVSPKAGFICRPLPNTVVRFAYTRSSVGASIDQSFQLEPSQVAGFIQSFRSIIPESVAGANAGAKFEAFGLSLEQKFHTGTYLGPYRRTAEFQMCIGLTARLITCRTNLIRRFQLS